MYRIMPCMGAHPPGGEEVVTMSLRLREDDVEVDVAPRSAAPAREFGGCGQRDNLPYIPPRIPTRLIERKG